MRDFVLVKGPESKFLWANKAFLNYYGMTEEQMRDIIDAPHSDPDDTLQYVRDDKYVFDHEVDLNIPSEPVAKPSGEVNYYHTIKSPVFVKGKMVESVGVSRRIEDKDLENQKLTELDAKVFTAPLRAIINTIPVGTMLLDHDFRIIKCNEKWCELFGEAPGDINSKFHDHFEALEALISSTINSLHSGEEVEKVIRLEIEGVAHFFDFKITPWKYPNNTSGGLIVVATDVTSIKKNEVSLENSNEQLSMRNEELTQFAYRTSHDLKAPLATIKGLTYFIEEDLEDGDISEVKKNVQQVHKQASKLEKLVVDILDLAKADLQVQEYTEVNLSTLCSEIKESYSELLVSKNVNFETSFPSDIVIFSQETRLRQVLSNLIANSIKYSNKKVEKSFVRVECDIEDHINIKIVDNGVGIDMDNSEHLFDMFSRFNPDLAEGSGLGMSIVKKNIETLNGEISFSSSKLGTQFDIKIPVMKR